MTETPQQLIGRLARLLNEELEPRGICFVLVVARQDGDDVEAGMLSNTSPEAAEHMVIRSVFEMRKNPRGFELLDAEGRNGGHA